MMMPRYVDRSFAKMVAYKRIITGTLGIISGGIITFVGFTQERAFSPLFAIAIVIFVGGGGWALRDGLRLRRELSS
ncbi:hypothetical protein LZC95_32060 [Pendulispora brunnea]|uniref:Uncharacterized protein n=1 Tax=Pendulispora brunnea TaxID=2905690 RepID=A0ABZ2JXC6_9BACT